MSNRRWIVYCHTNRANGMKYIGRTCLNPVHRWGIDGNGYDRRNAFGKDIEKYGWNNFSHEILEYNIHSASEADEIERRYISEMNTIFPNGYNTEDGGIHGSSNPHEKRDKRPRTGWHHSDETKAKISEGNKRADTHPMEQRINKSKPVDMFAKDGTYIRSFYGANEASRETGIAVSTICKVCKDTTGRFKSAGGYIWKYKGVNNELEKNGISGKTC